MSRHEPRTRRSPLQAWALVLFLLVLPTFAACGSGDGGGEVEPAFFLAGSTPQANAIFVARDQVVRVSFNKALDPTTVDTDSIVVTGGQGEVHGTAALTNDGSGATLTWTPGPLLAPDTLHTCRLHSRLRSIEADFVGGPTSFNFRTVPETTPSFLPTRTQLRATTGMLNVGRQAHEATLLSDGRVLITGGFTQNTATTDRAEVFLSGSGTFTELPNRMQQDRASHTATRLDDGRVLICGGWIELSPGNVITTAAAELFNPGSNSFSSLPNMTKARVAHAALLRPDGTVLITGGSRLDGNFLTDFDDAEVFDPATMSFSAHPEALVHTRSDHGMVDAGDGTYILAGGSDQNLSVGRYDLSSHTFEDLGFGAGDAARFGPAVAAFPSGGVVVAGGDLTGTVMYVWPGSGIVQNTGSGLNRARANATASPVIPPPDGSADQLLIVGGIDYSRGGFIEASVDLVVEGGVGGSRTYGTDVRFPHGMVWHTATLLPNNQILFCGGLNVDGTQPNLREAFLFTP